MHYIRRHNRIMHERQAEAPEEEWQRYCYPCDKYFGTEGELVQHHETCTKPLRFITFMEGEILSARSLMRTRSSRDGEGEVRGDNETESLVSETVEAMTMAMLRCHD